MYSLNLLILLFGYACIVTATVKYLNVLGITVRNHSKIMSFSFSASVVGLIILCAI